jgi:predicted nucleic acid-binding protein
VTLCADTSALVKLVLTEEGTELMRSVAAQSEKTYTSTVAYAELRAAVAAAVRDSRVPVSQRDRVMTLLIETWESTKRVETNWPLVVQAGDLAERYGLRGYDAIHLAALIRVGGPDAITLACWDTDLRRAASDLGLRLFP